MTGTLLADYLDRKALAAELRVSERTVVRYENQPDGLPSTQLGGRVLYRISSVMAWLDQRERHPNPTKGKRARGRA